MKPVLDWSSDFDHLDVRWVENPYVIWRQLRAKCPIAHTRRYGGVYLPTRYADICAIANDPEHFSSHSVVVRDFAAPQYSNPPINSDPPEHADHRRILLPAFSPDAIRKLEPSTRAICRELLQTLHDRAQCDAALEYAQHVPSRVITLVLGLPKADADLFRRWIYQTLDAGATEPAAGETALTEMTAYFSQLITQRRNAPADDLVSFLLRAEVGGRPLDEQHIVGTLRLLLIAGIDTTWSMISASLLHLAIHGEDRARLVRDPASIEATVEELLRAYSPVTMARQVIKDCEVGGTHLKAGEMVLLPFAAANRDPEEFSDPERVRIDRERNRHVAFGHGRHRCIGAGLARMEIKVALQEWLAQYPVFRRADNRPIPWSKGTVRGPRSVRLLLS